MDQRRPARCVVLIADDDTRAARILAQLLREDGFEVLVVHDGAAAVGQLSRDPLPDVLITDWRMPHVDGRAVVSYARSRKPGIPVIMVTSYKELASTWADALDPPAVTLAKPLAYQELARVLEQLREALNS